MNISVRLVFVFFVFFFIACNPGGITKQEIGIVRSGGEDEIMSLFTINNLSDSLLLRQNARKLKPRHIKSKTVQTLRKRMLATVNDPQNPGVGIAAPQVGVSISMIYVQRLDKQGEPFEVYYNPVIEEHGSDIALGREGCLSVPRYWGQVERSRDIKITYLDSIGVRRNEKINGFVAVIFQHEIDHINGTLYYDRVDDGFSALTSEK